MSSACYKPDLAITDNTSHDLPIPMYFYSICNDLLIDKHYNYSSSRVMASAYIHMEAILGI